MAHVELDRVDKWFGASQVIKDLSITAEDGSFVVLLGPSGCGKSTKLRLLAGLEKADGGTIRIGGAVVNDVPAAERGLAMVFQSYALFPHLSVAENSVFGLKVRRVGSSERSRRMRQAADLLGLTPFLDRKPALLSGGQRQRVALARALVSGASLILMDEPLSNLDAKLRQQMRFELRQLQRQLGLTVIYVTHDQVEAMTMADKVVVMQDGQVDQIAPPRDLYDWPARADVARFIGAPPMCLMPATVDGQVARIEGTNVAVLLSAQEGALPQRVLLGIRPEDITVHPADGTIAMPCQVVACELLGADLLVRLDAGAPEQLLARWHSRAAVSEDSTIEVGLPSANLHLFDMASGERLPVGVTGSADANTEAGASLAALESRV